MQENDRTQHQFNVFCVLSAICAVVGFGSCSAPTSQGIGNTPAAAGYTPPASDDPSSLPQCRDPAPTIAELTSYSGVEPPATYWVNMNVPAGANAWQPVSFIRMPHHHASRLDLQNLEELRLLAEHRREVVRFTIEITSRDIYKVPDRYQWFATYTARVLELCTPAQQ